MKQTYEKPMISIEYLTLSQSVATGCGAAAGGNSLGGPDQWTKETCAWCVGDEKFFYTVGICGETEDDVLPPEFDDIGGVCYNNPEGGNNIFNS